MAERRCIGFGEHEGRCTRVAGTRWSPYWCERCDAERREHISRQFERMERRAAARSGEAEGGAGDD